MLELAIKYFVGTLFLAIIQILFFNQIHLFGYITPMLYFYYILITPNKVNFSLFLVLAFAVGFTIDSFSDSNGLHAASCVFLAFVQRFWLNITNGQNKYDEIGAGDPVKFPPLTFTLFIVPLIVVFHFVLFMLEAFDFSLTLVVIKTTATTSLLSFLFVMMYKFLPLRGVFK